MASNFPSSLDSFTNPSSTDAMDSVSVPHATQHSDLNDAVEAIETALLDGAPLHIDDANERVGVGNVSPSYKLDVTGDINATGDLRIGGTAVGDWTTWTPTVTPLTGTFTTLGTVVGRYCVVNGLLEGYIDIPITTNGTGSGQIIFTLPANASTAPGGAFIGECREIAATGTLSVIWYDITPGSARINTFANTYPGADGYRLVGHFRYEVA